MALKQTTTGWTYGVLFNHIWSFAGEDGREDIKTHSCSPSWRRGWGREGPSASISSPTYDWEGEQWTVPLNLGYSKVSRIGTQLASYQGGVRYYLDAPDNGPE